VKENTTVSINIHYTALWRFDRTSLFPEGRDRKKGPHLNYRTLGRTGLQVSEIGFGGAPAGLSHYIERWDAAGEAEGRDVIEAVRAALDSGINYFDTAPGYGAGRSESLFGQGIAGRREECILATKTPIAGSEEIVRSVEASLSRLQTEVIDVLQFHGSGYSPAEVDRILNGGGLEAYQTLKAQGKVRFLGFTAEGPSVGAYQLMNTGAFDVMQMRYNFMYQSSCDYANEAGIIRDAKRQGMGVVTMRSLTSGTFQQLMRRAFPQLKDADLDGFLLNYNLSNPFLDVVLVGMRRKGEVEKNVALANDVSLRWDLEAVHRRYVEVSDR
jgi:aryl-alcohol dehydrogenase-like predicted oxidoreductase